MGVVSLDPYDNWQLVLLSFSKSIEINIKKTERDSVCITLDKKIETERYSMSRQSLLIFRVEMEGCSSGLSASPRSSTGSARSSKILNTPLPPIPGKNKQYYILWKNTTNKVISKRGEWKWVSIVVKHIFFSFNTLNIKLDIRSDPDPYLTHVLP